MEHATARELWHVLEPYHAIVYFAPEKKHHYDAAGLKGGWMGYFASRSAAMGPVSPDVVIATFYNFHPSMVRRAIPDAWRYSTPERVLDARQRAADAALVRLLGDAIDADEVITAATLAAAAAKSCDPGGRPLFAAHAALPWPEAPHMVLWHAATLLREFRGDGHVTALVAHEVDGCEAHVLIAAAGITPAPMLREHRWWSEEEWSAASERLRERGFLDGDSGLTSSGAALRRDIEAMTDRLASPPFGAIGAASTDELRASMRSVVTRIHEGDDLTYPNPIGLPPPRA